MVKYTDLPLELQIQFEEKADNQMETQEKVPLIL